MRTAGKYWILTFMCVISVTLGCSFVVTPVLCFQSQLFRLHLYDESSGEEILNAVVVATDGVYTTYLLLSDDCFLGGEAGEALYTGVYRPGTYDITITADGFAPQVLEDVVMESDDNVVEPMEVPMSQATP